MWLIEFSVQNKPNVFSLLFRLGKLSMTIENGAFTGGLEKGITNPMGRIVDPARIAMTNSTGGTIPSRTERDRNAYALKQLGYDAFVSSPWVTISADDFVIGIRAWPDGDLPAASGSDSWEEPMLAGYLMCNQREESECLP